MDKCISDSAADGAFRASIVAEGLTGKIYLPGRDRFGRQVVIFDNSVQNTKGDHTPHDADKSKPLRTNDACCRARKHPCRCGGPAGVPGMEP